MLTKTANAAATFVALAEGATYMGGNKSEDGAPEVGAPALLGALDAPLTEGNLQLNSAEDLISSYKS